MTKLRELEKQVRSLSMRDLGKLRVLIAELQAAAWDAEIEKDSRSGALDSVIEEARAEDARGEATPL